MKLEKEYTYKGYKITEVIEMVVMFVVNNVGFGSLESAKRHIDLLENTND